MGLNFLIGSTEKSVIRCEIFRANLVTALHITTLEFSSLGSSRFDDVNLNDNATNQ